MKFRLVCVGRLSASWLRDGAKEYLKRLQRHYAVEVVELKEEQGGKDIGGLLQREGVRIMARIPETARVIVLDERGQSLGSEALAERLQEEMLHGGRDWCLIIGGPYGLDPQLRKRADLILSLSRLTLTHQMARLVLLEQLYRAGTIVRNEPYHNR